MNLENNPTDGDSKPKFPLRTPSCLYCTAKQKPALAQAHWITNCPFVTCLARPEITQMLPDVCLGCLRKKRRNQVHKCPDFLKKASRSSGPQFCASCKSHTKLCISPSLHQAVTLPESFAGAGLMEKEYTLIASTMASSTPWPTEAVNKSALGQTTLLTCWLTLQNGNDSIRVQSLWDSESESSFFNQGLLPFATHQRRIDFKLETLSCVAKKPEVVKGIEASFEV